MTLAVLSILLAPPPALAGDLIVTVRDAAGRPTPNAVVMVRPASGVPAAPIRFPWPYTVAQQNIQFDPFVLVVPVGATVGFPNRDKVRHHVYSFSAGNKFELKLFGRDESRSVVFRAPGGMSRRVATPSGPVFTAQGVSTTRMKPTI